VFEDEYANLILSSFGTVLRQMGSTFLLAAFRAVC